MTATDHLSPVQFMPMHEVDALRSTMTGGTVADATPRIRAGEAGDSPKYMDRNRESMRNEGQHEPITVRNGSLEDGHHRVVWAHDLGWKGLNARVSKR